MLFVIWHIDDVEIFNLGNQMIETTSLHQPSASFNYYRGDVYWNNFEAIIEHINIQISGDRDVGWQQYLKSRYGNFEKAFFPSCGNGWVERELFGLGCIEHVILELVCSMRPSKQQKKLVCQLNI